MYSARDNGGHLKVCLTLILEVNCGGQMTNVSYFEIPKSDIINSKVEMILYHLHNP